MMMKETQTIWPLCKALRPALGLPAADTPVEVTQEMAEFATVRHRIGPLLYKSCAEALERAYRSNAVDQLYQKASEAELSRVLASSGVDFLFVKGVGLAQQLYVDPVERTSKDIDILIRFGQARRAIAALNNAEYVYQPTTLTGRKLAPIFRQNLDIHILKDLTFRDENFALTIEVHQRLFKFEPTGFSRDLFDACAPSASANAPTLAAAHYSLYLILHGAMSFWQRLKWVADASLLLRKMPDNHVRNIMRLADRYGCVDALVSSVLLVEKAFPGSVSETWQAALAPHNGRQSVEDLLAFYIATLTSPDINHLNANRGINGVAHHTTGRSHFIFPGQFSFLPSFFSRWISSLIIRI